MKNSILVLTFFLFSIHLYGQNSGLGFNYQAVVRGADGFVLPKQSVELRFSLFPGQQATEASWVETHSVTTDAYGTVGVTVGKGVKAGGTAAEFKDVNFADAYYWMKVEIKEGANYRELHFAALPGVPYAEVATHPAVNSVIDAAIKAAIDAAVEAASVPVGTIIPFAGDKIPAGWELCDGRQMNRTGTYAKLFAAIGTAWGTGNGSSTFNLPDLRGMFLRGVSGTSGRDADANSRTRLSTSGNTGNNVGSYQEDAIRKIYGTIGIVYIAKGTRGGSVPNDKTGVFSDTPQQNVGKAALGNDSNGYAADVHPVFDANVGTSADNPMAGHANGGDIRPKNVYVNYIIKY